MKYIVVTILLFFSLSAANAEIYTSLAKALKNPLKVDSLDLNSQQLKEFPQEIFLFRNLVYLNLCSNQLTSLPAEIGNLVNLKALLLVSNQLTILPAEIGNLVNLTSLDLSSNELTILPFEITKLKNCIIFFFNFHDKIWIAPSLLYALKKNNCEVIGYRNPLESWCAQYFWNQNERFIYQVDVAVKNESQYFLKNIWVNIIVNDSKGNQQYKKNHGININLNAGEQQNYGVELTSPIYYFKQDPNKYKIEVEITDAQ